MSSGNTNGSLSPSWPKRATPSGSAAKVTSLRFYEADAPARMSNSRFQALATTIYELGFVENLYAERHPLSPDGRRLLDDGDLPEQPLHDLIAQIPADDH